VACTAAAAATDRLLIGTGICLVIERDPIVTAKEVASVDRLSDGRFLFGVGAGWNAEEMENHGTAFSRRFGIMRERIEAMKAIWTEDEASYAGRYVNFERIWCWPKPVQQPHPPVLVGGNGRQVLDRVLAFGDEWMPNRMSDEDTLTRVAELQSRAAEAGRDSIPVTIVGMAPDASRIERLEQGGVHRIVFWLPPRGRGEVESAFDRFAALAREYAGAP
jgi:probable F420-dependent oxidoreductase